MIYYCLNLEIFFFKKKSHWIIQRFAISLFVPLIYFVCEYNTLNTLIVCFFILSLHFFEGLVVLIDDYVHDGYLYLYLTTFIKVAIFFIFKSVFVFFV